MSFGWARAEHRKKAVTSNSTYTLRLDSAFHRVYLTNMIQVTFHKFLDKCCYTLPAERQGMSRTDQ